MLPVVKFYLEMVMKSLKLSLRPVNLLPKREKFEQINKYTNAVMLVTMFDEKTFLLTQYTKKNTKKLVIRVLLVVVYSVSGN